MEHTCTIHDRHYSSWEFIPSLSISPIDHHLFDEDQFLFDSGNITLLRSIRNAPYIAGVLVLENGKTYGRTANKKRLFYSCIPYNKKLPIFLIPYDLELGFSKSIPNKYVLFTFDSWTNKHPLGLLKETLGDVTNLPSYYEYQIYCKHLHVTTKQIRAKIKEHVRPDIPFRKDHIFSIDPSGCTDRDDAFSVQKIDTHYKVSVYIANVWVWLETFQLWDSIGERKSTIYLPDRNRPMLPLIEKFCSLDAKQPRFAFVMDFIVDGGITASSLSQVQIGVSKNYDYESSALLKNDHYQLLLNLTQQLEKREMDSHEVVSFWMTTMNKCIANQMREKEIGIFRVVEGKIRNPFFQIWENQMTGSYVKYDKEKNLSHAIMDSVYVHFTSPIRRMCDLLNQMVWVYHVLKSNVSPAFIYFLEKQMNEMDSLNKQMKDIRKIQTDANMLYQCTEHPELLKEIFEGIVLYKSENHCTIYIEKYKWILTAKSDTLQEKVFCKLFLFIKEDQLKRKIRLQVINDIKISTEI